MAASRWLAAVNELHVCGTFQLDKSYVGDGTLALSVLWEEAISFPIKPSQPNAEIFNVCIFQSERRC